MKLISYYFKKNFRLEIPVLVFFLVFLFTETEIRSQNWEQVTFIDSNEVLTVLQHRDFLFAITEDQIYTNNTDLLEWRLTKGKPQIDGSYTTLYSYKDYLYLGTLNEGVFRSPDNGESWEEFNIGLTQNAKSVIEISGMGDSLFIGTKANGIFMLDLEQNVWQSYNQGLTRFGTISLSACSDRLYAGVGFNFFVRGRNDSAWSYEFFNSTEVQNDVFEVIGYNGFIFAGTDKGIYRKSLNDNKWQVKDIRVFPGQNIISLSNFDNKIYAGLVLGNEHWIFYTEDYGEDWDILAHEFSWLNGIYAYRGYLWAARLDGLWYLKLSNPTEVDEPEGENSRSFNLRQNYPNPFNPTTVIEYTLPEISNIQLEIYNSLGELVRTLETGTKKDGLHTTVWDGTDNNGKKLSSGIYIYKIITDNFIESKKMIMMK